MEILDHYKITASTDFFAREYLDHHEILTRVIEGNRSFLVRKDPLKIIEESLLRSGSDYLGSIHSSKFLLGPVRKFPLTINLKYGIFLFATDSFHHRKCIWFSLMNIKDVCTVNSTLIKVTTNSGHYIFFNAKESTFRNEWNKAKRLRELVLENE